MSLLAFGFSKQKTPVSLEPELEQSLREELECDKIPDELSDSESQSTCDDQLLDDDVRHIAIPEERDAAIFVEVDMLDGEIQQGPVAVDIQHIGGSGRGFRKEWIANRPWLEYI